MENYSIRENHEKSSQWLKSDLNCKKTLHLIEQINWFVVAKINIEYAEDDSAVVSFIIYFLLVFIALLKSRCGRKAMFLTFIPPPPPTPLSHFFGSISKKTLLTLAPHHHHYTHLTVHSYAAGILIYDY